jgi:hypothetical protein
MNIVIIDGQGGQLGAQIVKEVISRFKDVDVTAIGTNAVATASMLKAGAKNVWMSMFENVQGMDTPGQRIMGHFSWCYVFNDAVTMSQEQSEGDVKPTNNGGGTVAPQGHANIFEWMNAQVLTAPVPVQQNRR